MRKEVKKMILAEKIMNLRKRCGWSQEELAEKLGVSRQSVSKWESGMSIPDMEKIIKMSGVFGVSTDFLLKDEISEITPGVACVSYDEEEGKPISLEEANLYMDTAEGAAGPIANAVSLFIISPALLVFLAGMQDSGMIGISENMAAGIGVSVLLIIVAIGVAMIMPWSMKLSKFSYLDSEKVTLMYGVQGVVEQRRNSFEPFWMRNLTLGVGLCIAGAVPLMLTTITGKDFAMIAGVALLLITVSIGVNRIVRGGMVQGSFTRLLQMGDYSPENKEFNKSISHLSTIYWCSATALYLGISFYFNNWERSWIIWPVAGVLYGAICAVAAMVIKAAKK